MSVSGHTTSAEGRTKEAPVLPRREQNFHGVGGRGGAGRAGGVGPEPPVLSEPSRGERCRDGRAPRSGRRGPSGPTIIQNSSAPPPRPGGAARGGGDWRGGAARRGTVERSNRPGSRGAPRPPRPGGPTSPPPPEVYLSGGRRRVPAPRPPAPDTGAAGPAPSYRRPRPSRHACRSSLRPHTQRAGPDGPHPTPTPPPLGGRSGPGPGGARSHPERRGPWGPPPERFLSGPGAPRAQGFTLVVGREGANIFPQRRWGDAIPAVAPFPNRSPPLPPTKGPKRSRGWADARRPALPLARDLRTRRARRGTVFPQTYRALPASTPHPSATKSR